MTRTLLSVLSRRIAFLFFALTAGLVFSSRSSAADDAVAPVQGLCDALIGSMKKGSELDFHGRFELLGPEIRRDLDLPLMTRVVVGPTVWKSLSADDQKNLVDAFSDYSIGTYAQRFKSYSNERFEVDPASTPSSNGRVVVHTKLFTNGPAPVQLDYLVRKADDKWQVIDVFLSGTISELAARRSEYATVLRQGGAPSLIDLLKKKTAEFGH